MREPGGPDAIFAERVETHQPGPIPDVHRAGVAHADELTLWLEFLETGKFALRGGGLERQKAQRNEDGLSREPVSTTLAKVAIGVE